MITEDLYDASKQYHARGGGARVFGTDSDVRRKMSDSDALKRFTEVWTNTLEPEVRNAPHITLEEARELLEGKQREYALEGHQYRQFSIQSAVFIARLNTDADENGVCDQLWSLGAHRDTTRLCMYFDTVEQKQQFDKLASRCGWQQPRDLALRLALDFMEKHKR